MRRPLKEPRIPLDVLLGTLLGGALLGGGAVVGVGLFDVSARGGHWPGVPWVLHTTYVNSVELNAPPAASVPELDDEALVALGAAHFDSACSQCHGAPGRPRGATVRAMLPEPPHVTEAVAGWEPEHLFWILREGVKMSGMPHWPSTVRDDDVWAVVAFLERVGTLDEAGYEALLGAQTGAQTGNGEKALGAEGATNGAGRSVSGDGPTEATLRSCATCHGLDGASGGNTHIPRLDLLDEDYIAASLLAYRDDERHSGIMQHAAGALGGTEIARLAKHYAKERTPAVNAGGATPDETATARTSTNESTADGADRAALLARGAALATGGEPSRNLEVPVCAACHGPWPTPLTARYPDIAGQHEGFLLAQLRAWRAGTRGGTSLARLMHEVVPALEEDDLAALAAYYAAATPADVESP